jgi:hypothetical protein
MWTISASLLYHFVLYCWYVINEIKECFTTRVYSRCSDTPCILTSYVDNSLVWKLQDVVETYSWNITIIFRLKEECFDRVFIFILRDFLQKFILRQKQNKHTSCHYHRFALRPSSHFLAAVWFISELHTTAFSGVPLHTYFLFHRVINAIGDVLKYYFHWRRIWALLVPVFLIKNHILSASSTCGWVIKQIPAKVEECNAERLFWEMLILPDPLNLEQEMTLQRLQTFWGRRSMFQLLSFCGEWRDPNPFHPHY